MTITPQEVHVDLFGSRIDLSAYKDASPPYKVKKKVLRSVVFEVRHLPHFEMASGKAKIIREFQGNYPSLLFYQGNNQLEDGIRMEKSPSGTGLFWPQCQLVSFETASYESFSKFSAWVKDDFSKYDSVFPIPNISRVGLRYVNNFKINKIEDVTNELKRFSLDFRIGDEKPKLAALMFTHIMPPGVAVTTRLGVKTQGDDIFLEWDNDVYAEGLWPASYAVLFLPLLHSAATDMFLGLLSEEMKNEYIEVG